MVIYDLANVTVTHRAAAVLDNAGYYGLASELRYIASIVDRASARTAIKIVKQVQRDFIDTLPDVISVLKAARYASMYAILGELSRVQGYAREALSLEFKTRKWDAPLAVAVDYLQALHDPDAGYYFRDHQSDAYWIVSVAQLIDLGEHLSDAAASMGIEADAYASWCVRTTLVKL